ncbi:DoxX family protein [Streptomyces gobiensis]|uniref:DoxX family protein n=1 Tax=Streptomyces gobiensis TaxID=2875706 RepID=UPI001E515089|nr:DoxX family protein [Streptomyces gobiensis]UGY90996.1 DoxX family protein [Streptomyces gobiensis]
MTAQTAPSTTPIPTPQSRKANIALWTLQIITAGMFLMGAVIKLTASAGSVESFDQIGFGGWFLYFIGAAELAGGIGLLVPRLTGLAALSLTALMIGAVITEVVVFGGGMVIAPIVALACVATIAWGRRQSTAALVQLLRERG